MIPELEEIKRILLHEWDPIGVSHVPAAADEYDSYAFRVFISLYQGATAASIATYLRRVKLEHMRLSIGSGRIDDVSEKVMQVHTSSRGSSGH